MDIASGTRVSDAERKQVADLLVRSVGEGRIDLAEYDGRLERVYSAATQEDLRAVVADLPKAPASARNSKAAPRIPVWQRIEGGAWLGVGLLNVLIWAAVSLGLGEFVYFWPIWVIGPWGAVLAFRVVAGWEARPCEPRAGRSRPAAPVRPPMPARPATWAKSRP
ncbi:DUF1707 SHOCT-like domain-containing protein [Nocardia pseudobrasiliensis]|uniref:Uncharacterized protein DUF1707 n=1 Tax=Nocardia pseudobrasiliensis TaxID=45979 RepID=A0A370IFI2_9NOCA|nr:DUF1707 domain-containing protein [Nocardia pseudobrasiliensis]RDI69453.1 uncharacterized protein DUF1707 [Nocardia pseudobrasiliensis]